MVGAEIARRTEVVKLTRGRNGGPSSLEIRVAGPAAAIIQHQAHEILARVNLFLGADAVQKLRIVQGPLQAARPPAPPRRRLPPLDAAQEARLAADRRRRAEGKAESRIAGARPGRPATRLTKFRRGPRAMTGGKFGGAVGNRALIPRSDLPEGPRSMFSRRSIALGAAATFLAGAALAAPSALPDDMSLGNPKAKVQVIEYASLSCPHCAHFNETVFAPFKATWVDTGKVPTP